MIKDLLNIVESYMGEELIIKNELYKVFKKISHPDRPRGVNRNIEYENEIKKDIKDVSELIGKRTEYNVNKITSKYPGLTTLFFFITIYKWIEFFLFLIYKFIYYLL